MTRPDTFAEPGPAICLALGAVVIAICIGLLLLAASTTGCAWHGPAVATRCIVLQDGALRDSTGASVRADILMEGGAGQNAQVKGVSLK